MKAIEILAMLSSFKYPHSLRGDAGVNSGQFLAQGTGKAHRQEASAQARRGGIVVNEGAKFSPVEFLG